MYDVIIIGGGPAGLSAAIYASRRALNTLVISRDIGGQIAKTPDIENYPAVDKISGTEFANKLKAQAERFGAKIVFEETIKIKKLKNKFLIQTLRNKYDAKTVILASGKKPKELDVPGENKFKGRGVSYCATCDAPFFKNKTLAIAGGGNSALDAALLASKYCKKVYLIHRRDSFTGEQVLIDTVNFTKNIEVLFNSQIKEIKGDKVVGSVVLADGQEIKTDGIIIEVGFIVDHSLVEGLVKLDDKKQVIINNIQETSEPGIFAAGDLTQTPYKQAIISAAEGAKAALSSYDYLQKLQGKRGILADWHH
ncbi:MAG: FAD-dependent oxidoreductase [Patescibacteria group bacterium]|nr:FAD-dependent oxidoreductase [Patescibacteria group bacterium]